MFKRAYTAALPDQPAAVVNCLRVRLLWQTSPCLSEVAAGMKSSCASTLRSSALQDVDRWSFDVFALNSASSDRALQTVFFELIARYGLNGRFKVFTYDFWASSVIYGVHCACIPFQVLKKKMLQYFNYSRLLWESWSHWCNLTCGRLLKDLSFRTPWPFKL